jgi:hypothetical protein
MKNLTIAFAIAMTLMTFGCKKKGGETGEAMAKYTEFRDEMCKCKDAKCAQDVSDKMTKWGQEQSKNQKEPPKMNEADTKKFADIGKEMGDCMQKAMGAGGAMGGGTPEGGSAAAPAEGGSAAAPAEGSAAAPAAGSAAAPAAEGSAAK